MNQKGQAEDTFGLLIGVIFALALLGVMFMVVTMFSESQFHFSENLLVKSFEDATKSPNVSYDKPVNAKILFRAGHAITSKQLSVETGINEECILFDKHEQLDIVEISNNRRLIRFTIQQEQEVYSYCATGLDKSIYCDDSCNMCCVMSIRKEERLE